MINGLTIYKECWKWSKSYTCKGSNFTDTCQPLQGICEVKAQNALKWERTVYVTISNSYMTVMNSMMLQALN